MNLLIRSSLFSAALGAAALAQEPGRPPAAQAGPYRVVVDRISQNTNLAVNFGAGAAPAARPASSIEVRRMVQMQVSVFAATPEAAAALTTFQISGVAVQAGGRLLQLTPFGGMLDNPAGNTVLRAYLYVPTFPASAREVRAVEGQLVGYETARDMEIDIPVADGAAPKTVEKDGVKATLREYSFDGESAQLVLWLEGPATSALVNTATDGAYGMQLLDAEGRPATSSGGSFINFRPNTAEYRLGFNSLKRPPTTIRVKFLHRGGARRTYPFRIEGIPIPSRPTPAKAGPKPKP